MKKSPVAVLLAALCLLPLSALPKVAVLDIIAQKGIDSSAVVPVTESIMEEVVATRAYIVLDRAYIEQVLKEQEFDTSTIVSDTQIAQAGQYLGADYIITGKVQLLGDSFFLVGKMIEVRTGIIVSQSSEQGAGKITALLDMSHAIGKKLVAGAPISPLQPTAAGASAAPTAVVSPPAGKRIKAGFVMPIQMRDDDQAIVASIKRLEGKFGDWLDVVVEEGVAPDRAAAAFDKLADENKCDMIFDCSWSYPEQIVEAARRHPKTLFEGSGLEYREGTDPNLGVFGLNEISYFYFEGLVAASLSSSGKVGFLSEAASEGPWVIQIADYFALGVKAANPKASVLISFLPHKHWEVPGTDAAAGKALIAQGCDFLGGAAHPDLFDVLNASTMAGKRVRMFQPDLSYKRAPNVIVSGPLRDFGAFYERPLLALKDGKWKKEAFYPLSCAKFGGGGEPFNPAFQPEIRSKKVKTPDLGEIGLIDLIEKRTTQMESGEFNPFTGPLKDQKGKLRLPAGVRADDGFIQHLDWLLDNVKGSIPGR